MKKYLISFLAMLSLTVGHAQVFQSVSLINAKSIYISNAATFVTNLSSATYCPAGTNSVGVTFTNLSGNRVVTNNFNLLKTVPLVVDRNAANGLNGGIATNQNFYVVLSSIGAAATNGIGLVFAPVPDGVNEDVVSGDVFTYSVAAGTAPGAQILIPFPASKWPGVSKIRLEKVYTAAAPTAAASDFWIQGISYNAYVP